MPRVSLSGSLSSRVTDVQSPKTAFRPLPRCAEKQHAQGMSVAASVPILMEHSPLMVRDGARNSFKLSLEQGYQVLHKFET